MARKQSNHIEVAVIRFVILLLACGAQPIVAEEGGSGHYFPGSMASFMDTVSPTPALLLRYNQIYYTGSVGADRPLPIGGTTALGVHATSWGEGATIFWRPPVNMGKRWSYALSTTIPFLQMNVSANAIASTPGNVSSPTISRSGSQSGLGDLVLIPVMVAYIPNPNLNINFRLTFYAPTGSYAVGRLANTGKNYWTTEPTLAVIYLATKNGHEASLFTGFDFIPKTELPTTRPAHNSIWTEHLRSICRY